MKILFILDHFWPYIGGGETLFYELTRGLVKQGYHITVITSWYDTSLPQEDYIDGVKILRIGSNRINFQRYGAQKALQLLHKEKYDIIHGSTYFSMIPTWIISKKTGIKSILTVHEIYGRLWYQFVGWMGWINYFYEWISLTLLSFDHYICVSNYTKNCMRVMYGISDHRLSTVYNGIDYNFRDSSQISQHDTSQLRINHSITDSYIGLYFGRMGVAKGMDDVLKAIPHIIRHIPNYKQVFITPKKQSSRILGVKNTFSIEEVEQFIKEHQLESHIIWIESVPREELRSWIKTVSVVILPSRAEGFGFAVSEVCALGGNLITTNVASIPEVVYGNVNFVEPNNEYDISQKVFDFYHNKYETITERKFERGECIKDTSRLYQLIIKKGK